MGCLCWYVSIVCVASVRSKGKTAHRFAVSADAVREGNSVGKRPQGRAGARYILSVPCYVPVRCAVAQSSWY